MLVTFYTLSRVKMDSWYHLKYKASLYIYNQGDKESTEWANLNQLEG